MNKISVILLCASEGKKTKSFGPRSLLNIHGRALIDCQLEEISCVYPDAEIIVGLGYGADKIIKHLSAQPIKFVENENYNETNAARTLNICMRITNSERIIVIHGDILFNSDSIASPPNISTLLIEKSSLERDKVGLNIVGNQIIGFNYSSGVKWGQIAHLCGRELEVVRKLVSDRKNDVCCTHEILAKAINRGNHFLVYQNHNSQIKEVNRK
jgi:hypothetical protein